jgi:hypothetical protein
MTILNCTPGLAELVAASSRKVFEGIDAAELEVAGRVVTQVTERAREIGGIS